MFYMKFAAKNEACDVIAKSLEFCEYWNKRHFKNCKMLLLQNIEILYLRKANVNWFIDTVISDSFKFKLQD